MLIQYQIPWMVHFPRSFFVFVPLQALRVICEKALFFNKKAFDKMRRYLKEILTEGKYPERIPLEKLLAEIEG